LARYKARVSILSPSANQTFALAHANPETLGRLTLTKMRVHERTHQMRTLPLIGTHLQKSLRPSDPSPAARPKGNFLTLQEGDILALR